VTFYRTTKLMLLMSLMILLSSSSFFITEHLVVKLKNADYSAKQLAYALQLAIPLAYSIKRQQYVKGSPQWLEYSIYLAKTQADIAFELGLFFLQKSRVYAAKNNEKMLFWHQQAIRLGSAAAKISLAQYYYSINNIAAAKKNLNELKQNTSHKAIAKQLNAARVVLNAKIAIKQGAAIKPLLADLAKNEQGRALLAQIKHYQITVPTNSHIKKNLFTENATTVASVKCTNSIQFFATNLNDLAKAELLIEQFKSHVLNQSLCFLPVRYRSIKKLSCQNNASAMLSCNEAHWIDIAASIQTKYVAILLPQGGANVHLGLLYIDSNDTVEVLAHEISHLLGFIDEYPLPANHEKCRQQQPLFANNIAILASSYRGNKKKLRAKILSELAWAHFIKASTPIFHQDKTQRHSNDWLLGTPQAYQHEVGVFLSETCQNGSMQAFKPLLAQSQLRYFEKPFPELYQQILLKNGEQYAMPSFHYNLALALIKQGKTKQARLWLNNAAAFEASEQKKNRILGASF
jgi:hypothetical protein